MLSAFKAAREWAAPELPPAVAGVPWLTATGQLTAEDFVAAGDRLIRVSPGWRWSRALDGRMRPALPPAKQCLILEGVPCRAPPPRADAAGASTAADEEQVPGTLGDWLSAGGGGSGAGAGSSGAVGVMSGGGDDDDIPELGATAATSAAIAAPAAAADAIAGADDEYADLADFVDQSLLIRDPATASASAAAPAAAVAAAASAPTSRAPRTYQLSITYDGYYHTPRVFLRGFGAAGAPLGPEDMLADVVQDYVARSVTIETHPLLGTLCLSVHPCRHAATMKTLAAGARESPPPDAYLLLFLKFFSSVVPTIEYDVTMAM